MMFMAGTLIGMGTQAFGLSGQSKEAAQATAIQQQILGTDEKINDQRKQAMILDANRKQLQVARNVQMARARSQAIATNQGAQFGSGEAGALAGEEAEGAYNSLGISQDLAIGKKIFSLTNIEDQLKSQLAGVQTSEANYGAISALGGDIAGISMSFAKLFGGGGAKALGGPTGA